VKTLNLALSHVCRTIHPGPGLIASVTAPEHLERVVRLTWSSTHIKRPCPYQELFGMRALQEWAVREEPVAPHPQPSNRGRQR